VWVSFFGTPIRLVGERRWCWGGELLGHVVWSLFVPAAEGASLRLLDFTFGLAGGVTWQLQTNTPRGFLLSLDTDRLWESPTLQKENIPSFHDITQPGMGEGGLVAATAGGSHSTICPCLIVNAALLIDSCFCREGTWMYGYRQGALNSLQVPQMNSWLTFSLPVYCFSCTVPLLTLNLSENLPQSLWAQAPIPRLLFECEMMICNWF
jgi:hypothetical protein